ncbi:MAG: hypothetical protein NTY54_07045, partial [Actinobacteria bacterium]|nr:hypothetical protein [Actinomycetota bacterium]
QTACGNSLNNSVFTFSGRHLRVSPTFVFRPMPFVAKARTLLEHRQFFGKELDVYERCMIYEYGTNEY